MWILFPQSVETKTSTEGKSSDKSTAGDDGDTPKKKRGRPKSVTTFDTSDKSKFI